MRPSALVTPLASRSHSSAHMKSGKANEQHRDSADIDNATVMRLGLTP